MPTATKPKAAPINFRAPLLKFAEGFASDGDVATRVQLIRCGTFSLGIDPVTNKPKTIEITPQILQSFVQNFSDNVTGVDLAIDYKHENDDIAAGWITSVEYDDETKSVWAEVDWTPQGKKVLGDKEFRYVSAEFSRAYKHNETQKNHGWTLLGAGLTNRPFVKSMEPVVALSDMAADTGGAVLVMTMEEMSKAIQAMQAAVEKLSAGGPATPAAPPAPLAPVDSQQNDGQGDEENIEEDGEELDENAGGAPPPAESKAPGGKDGASTPPGAPPAKKPGDKKPPVKDLKNGASQDKGAIKMTDAEKQEMQALKDRNAVLEQQAKDAAASVKLSEKKAEFDLMLSEKKVVEAQREPFMKDDFKGYTAAAANPKTTRLSDAGAGDDELEGEKDPQDEILQLSDAMVKDGKCKTKTEAMSKVLSDPKNAALRKRYEDSSYNSGQALNTAK